ncbi:preprotein translocase subunit SecE [Anaerosporomusa subterranea]|jgi:preprotein translocase subunit SecE|uniref:Protein translocase subunit SecE n=1 Tax=Anaerosporomusa subterranea TaxID=1794912 RepID=A0A154BW21_ANASB|nr:preprotein translocase subunit SecE [Anaerosporomusa subterranea]KYZ77698.1 preprotein translocase subunit SecE [Anaerosporomusa subterranea]MDF2501825.1 secE [Anaerosporomusa subterranea]
MAAQETAVQTNTSRIKKFVREVRAELKKVSWPTRRELVAYTGVVFVSVVVVAALIWIIDTSFTGLLKAIIK